MIDVRLFFSDSCKSLHQPGGRMQRHPHTSRQLQTTPASSTRSHHSCSPLEHLIGWSYHLDGAIGSFLRLTVSSELVPLPAFPVRPIMFDLCHTLVLPLRSLILSYMLSERPVASSAHVFLVRAMGVVCISEEAPSPRGYLLPGQFCRHLSADESAQFMSKPC